MLKPANGYNAIVSFNEKEKMTPDNFCYWLQGYIEIQRATGQPIVITDREVRVIEEHLNLIFNKKVTYPIKAFGDVLTTPTANKNNDIFPSEPGLVQWMNHKGSC